MKSKVPHVNVCIDPNFLKIEAINLVKSLMNWSEEDEEIRVKPFTDGHSNLLVGVHVEHSLESQMVMVRVYGSVTSQLVDRDAEVKNLKKLFCCGLGSQIYATFNNGFCYEFIPGQVLSTELIISSDYILPLVASNLARIHSIPQDAAHDEKKSSDPSLMRTIDKYLNLLSNDHPMKCWLQQEVQEVSSHPSLKSDTDVVFCHNDLLPKNMILTSDKSSVVFIDYEYADYNLRAVDIADFFASIYGYDSENYPSLKTRKMFIDQYVKEIGLPHITSHELLEKTERYTCLPNLYWGIWALVQSATDSDECSIDFDYNDYAVKRFRQYLEKKHLLLL